jgi:hypothetical protein
MMESAVAKINELIAMDLGNLAEEKKPRERVCRLNNLSDDQRY